VVVADRDERAADAAGEQVPAADEKRECNGE